MQRMIMKELIHWRTKRNRKPLLLRGARRVGKTWLMKEFGRKHFKNTAYINFDSGGNICRIFDEDYDIRRIIQMINIETGVRVEAEETLIIFDEIQEAPKAISSLKYFCENAPEYAVIAAGSLLGVSIHEGISFPVGKINTLVVHPMSYREFLQAMGEEALAGLLQDAKYEMANAFSDKYIHWLKLYYYIGGMPEAVQDYVENGDIYAVREIQKRLLELYENDFSKHTPNQELARTRLVWNSVPLKAYIDFAAFKIYLLDMGLLGAMSELDAHFILEGNELFLEFKGALTKQYVLQQIVAETAYTPYYFSPSSHSEIDFMVQKDGGIVPVEVKAEQNLRAKSLKAYCEKYSSSYAVRTSIASYRKEEWMVNLPLYGICSL